MGHISYHPSLRTPFGIMTQEIFFFNMMKRSVSLCTESPIICLSIPQFADAVQICYTFWDPQYEAPSKLVRFWVTGRITPSLRTPFGIMTQEIFFFNIFNNKVYRKYVLHLLKYR